MVEQRVLTAYIKEPNQWHIDTYIRNGGYEALKKCLKELSSEKLVDRVIHAGLRGRGGAGFSTGKKWKFIPTDPALAKYVVCNADESEPGTYKDRLLIENDPLQVIEGITLASYAIGANMAFIYCRGEFYEGIAKLSEGIKQAKERGFLGHDILGSGFSLEIIVHPGAGAYIAGEETAQLNSLEGYPATPRLKPPFPAIEGLYSLPTAINNVETLCNVVHIVNNGVEWYQAIGKPNNRGTKIFQVSGHVRNPGCFEFPLGVSLRKVLEAAGWMQPGRSFKACFPGGSSCNLLLAKDLDIDMDFDSLAARGSALGTASIIVMDDTADMVKVAHRLMQFYQNESCGKCTPCREGTRWAVQILARIKAGKGTFDDLDVINQICQRMASDSFCPLAVGAAPPVLSAIAEFRGEFEEYIKCNPLADNHPKMRVSYPYV